jgi:hypothetical protein
MIGDSPRVMGVLYRAAKILVRPCTGDQARHTLPAFKRADPDFIVPIHCAAFRRGTHLYCPLPVECKTSVFGATFDQAPLGKLSVFAHNVAYVPPNPPLPDVRCEVRTSGR